jgi:septum formation protein
MSTMIAIPERGIYLASRSPRRRELLSQIGVRYHLLLFRERVGEKPEVDESVLPGEAPPRTSSAWRAPRPTPAGAACCSGTCRRPPVLAADTTVALDGRIYGKPENRAEAEEILAALAGKRHEVLTAVALKNQDWIEVALSTSEVQLKALSKDDIRAIRGERRRRRQGRRLRHPGARGAFRGRDPRQLFRHHGAAAVRDRPVDRPAAVSESMSEEVLINVTPQETRVAIIGAGVVQELLIERAASRGPGRQPLRRARGARAARHAVGVRRDRPGARRVPARRRHLEPRRAADRERSSPKASRCWCRC